MPYREGPMPSPYVVTAFGRYVMGLSVANGNELWRRQFELAGQRAIRIHVGGDEVIAVVGPSLHVLALATGEPRRRVELGDGVHDTLLVVGRRAFVSSLGVLSCVDLDAGKLLWRNELPGTGYGAAAIGVAGLVVQGDATG